MKSSIIDSFTARKQRVGKQQRGIAIGMLTLVLVIILGASYGVIGMIERSAHSAAEKIVSEVVNHIDAKMEEVENATREAAKTVSLQIRQPAELERLVQEFVEENAFVYGSTVAFEPNVFPQRGRCFAPYSWKTSDGKVHSRQLGTETDYYQEEWYAETKLSGEEYWCEPYFDEGGAKIMMCTFSIPLFGPDGKLLAVMTADVGLDDLEEYIETITPSPETKIVLLSKNGTVLVSEEQRRDIGNNNIIIKGLASIGWTVELNMPFTHLMRGDTGIFFIIGMIFLLTILLVYFINKFLVSQQQRASAEYMKVIGALSEDFISVEFVELKENNADDKAIEYRSSARLERIIPEWAKADSFMKKVELLVDNLVYEPDREQFKKDMKRETVLSQLNDSDQYFVNFRLFDKEIKFYQVKLSAVRDRGNLTGIVVGLHSIDEQMKKEIEQQKQMENALAMAQSANKAKTVFLNNMSHDIRTPMNAIIGFTAMAQKNIEDKEKALDYLSKINAAGNNLLEIVNLVLDMSRIESGKVVLMEEPADVIERAHEMVEIIGHTAQVKNIEIKTTINQIDHSKVYADGGRMNQLILNILGNAVKYTPEGGHIHYSVTQVPCKRRGYATYVFSTEDDGIGMSQEFLDKIFEPFTRENTTTVSKIQGTGLGMAIVKKLVDLMGGTIDINSAPGKGTKIDVTISFRLAEDGGTSEARRGSDQMSVLRGRHALLVEDNEMNREIAKMLLEEQGIIVETAEDGDVAVEMVKAAAENGEPGRYDFILMDIQMPRMNGHEATARIRRILEPAGIHTPIIALSANAFEEDRQTSREAGMDDHIAKPIDVTILWETLAKYTSIGK